MTEGERKRERERERDSENEKLKLSHASNENKLNLLYESQPAGTQVDGPPRAASSIAGGHVEWQLGWELCIVFCRKVGF